MQDLATIPVRGSGVRVLIVAVAVVAVALVYLGARWQLGDMLAALTDPSDEQGALIADAALSLAPWDPRASDLRAVVGQDPDSTDTRSVVEIAEQTVRLS